MCASQSVPHSSRTQRHPRNAYSCSISETPSRTAATLYPLYKRIVSAHYTCIYECVWYQREPIDPLSGRASGSVRYSNGLTLARLRTLAKSFHSPQSQVEDLIPFSQHQRLVLPGPLFFLFLFSGISMFVLFFFSSFLSRKFVPNRKSRRYAS